MDFRDRDYYIVRKNKYTFNDKYIEHIKDFYPVKGKDEILLLRKRQFELRTSERQHRLRTKWYISPSCINQKRILKISEKLYE